MALELVTVLPPASSTVTTGCEALGKATLVVCAPGEVVKTSCAAFPVEITNDALVAVSVPVGSTSVAVNV